MYLFILPTYQTAIEYSFQGSCPDQSANYLKNLKYLKKTFTYLKQ